MAKGNNSEYKKMIDKQYSDLMKHCQVQMEKIEKDLPEPKEDFQAVLRSMALVVGISLSGPRL